MIILYYISAFCIFVGMIKILVCILLLNKTKNIPKEQITNDASFCILIPARNESKVIENLLVSIQNQTYQIKPSSVYVIVEDSSDPTIEITKHHQMNVFVRTNVEGRKRKGYALDETLKNIDEIYDAYVIVDADNILDQNFLQEINETYKRGYDIGVGYRNCKNGNSSIFAATSALTFSMINTLSNKARTKRNKNIIISGTGFYIRGEWIKKWNGYPFHSLTEDYELSLYATLHNMTSTYNEKAIFFDEQPITYKETVKQRIRWIKGYFDSRKEYIPLLKKEYKNKNANMTSQYQATVGVKPYIWVVIGLVFAFINEFIRFFNHAFLTHHNFVVCFKFALILLGTIYGFLWSFTLLLLLLEGTKINLSWQMKIKALFLNPIFLITYVYCVLQAVIKKEVEWDAITHNFNKIS